MPVKGSFVVARGFASGALLLLGAVLAILALAAFFQYRAEAHNDRAGALASPEWQAPTQPTY
jgi:hypothetical protein